MKVILFSFIEANQEQRDALSMMITSFGLSNLLDKYVQMSPIENWFLSLLAVNCSLSWPYQNELWRIEAKLVTTTSVERQNVYTKFYSMLKLQQQTIRW